MLTFLINSSDSIGRKGENLRHLAQRGYPIPSAYVFAWNEGLPCNTVFRQEIETLMTGTFAGRPVIVRSSASDEDRPIGNSAGVYESFLNLRSVNEVLQAVKLCGESLCAPQAEAYRRLHHIPLTATMHILIQEMVPCEISGVLYTRNPIAERGTMLIETTAGLGTSIVTSTHTDNRFELQRRSVWRKYSNWEVANRQELGEVLLNLGHLLEEEFDAPQEIEWGIYEGQLYLFQSRNASLSKIRLPTPAQRPQQSRKNSVDVISPGYAIGFLTNVSAKPTSLEIVHLDRMPTTAELELLAESSALVVSKGNVCSHAAANCRELGIPVVLANELLPATSPMFIDAVNGEVAPLSDLPASERKKAIFSAVRQLAARGVGRFREENKYETVVFDPVAQGRIRSFVHDAIPDGLSNARQIIRPYDDAERTYCGISARIQSTEGSSRLQFKRANILPDRPFRFDEEICLEVDSIEETHVLLESLGYVAFDIQERELEVATINGVRIVFNLWPGAPQPYLGLEARSLEDIHQILKKANVPLEECEALDGKDLFRRLSLSLSNLRFPLE